MPCVTYLMPKRKWVVGMGRDTPKKVKRKSYHQGKDFDGWGVRLRLLLATREEQYHPTQAGDHPYLGGSP
jgi:hypothetical protein